MGNKNYSGGNSLLNNEAGFTTFDPAEEQKKTDLHSEHSNTRFRSPPRYFIQVQQRVCIVLIDLWCKPKAKQLVAPRRRLEHHLGVMCEFILKRGFGLIKTRHRILQLITVTDHC